MKNLENLNLEKLVLRIVNDFPEGISQTQIIRFVLESGYHEPEPGLLAQKVRKIVCDLSQKKVFLKGQNAHENVRMRFRFR